MKKSIKREIKKQQKQQKQIKLQRGQKMKNILIIGLVIIVAGLGGYVLKLNKDLQKLENRVFIQEIEIKLLEFETSKETGNEEQEETQD